MYITMHAQILQFQEIQDNALQFLQFQTIKIFDWNISFFFC